MVKCHRCGHDNDERGKYCGVCGANIHVKGFNPENHRLNSYTKAAQRIAPKKKESLFGYMAGARAVQPKKKKNPWVF